MHVKLNNAHSKPFTNYSVLWLFDVNGDMTIYLQVFMLPPPPPILSDETPMYLSLFFLAFFLSSLSLSSSWTNSTISFTFWRTLIPWSLPFSSGQTQTHKDRKPVRGIKNNNHTLTLKTAVLTKVRVKVCILDLFTTTWLFPLETPSGPRLSMYTKLEDRLAQTYWTLFPFRAKNKISDKIE